MTKFTEKEYTFATEKEKTIMRMREEGFKFKDIAKHMGHADESIPCQMLRALQRRIEKGRMPITHKPYEKTEANERFKKLINYLKENKPQKFTSQELQDATKIDRAYIRRVLRSQNAVNEGVISQSQSPDCINKGKEFSVYSCSIPTVEDWNTALSFPVTTERGRVNGY